MKQVKKVLCIKILFVLFLCFSLIGIKTFSVNAIATSTTKLNKTKTTLIVGERSKLKVKNVTENVIWSSSNKNIVKVSKQGTIRGIKKGTATITAKVGTKKLTCNVTVKEEPKLEKNVSICVGKRVKLQVTGTAKTVTWSSSNKNIVKISKKGTIRGIKQGTATIRAKVGSKKLNCKVQVKRAVGNISNGLSIENVGWKGIYYYSDEVYCSSSNTKVATVAVIPYGYVENNYEKEADIVVFGHKSGTANITITNNYNDEKVTFKVKVKKPEVSTNYQKLVDYILLNGEVEDGTGDKIVLKEGKEKNITATISYDTMSEQINYGYEETNDLAKVKWLMMPTEKDNTEVYMVMWIYPVNSTEEYYVTTTIDTKTYVGEEIVFEEGWYRIPALESLQGIANEVSKNAIAFIDEILQSEVGVTWREANKF